MPYSSRAPFNLFPLTGSLLKSTGDAEEQAEIEEQRKAKIEAERKGKGKLDLLAEIKTRIPSDRLTHTLIKNLMAKITVRLWQLQRTC